MEIRMILVCSIGYILGMAVFEFFKWKVNCIKRPPDDGERKKNHNNTSSD